MLRPAFIGGAVGGVIASIFYLFGSGDDPDEYQHLNPSPSQSLFASPRGQPENDSPRGPYTNHSPRGPPQNQSPQGTPRDRSPRGPSKGHTQPEDQQDPLRYNSPRKSRHVLQESVELPPVLQDNLDKLKGLSSTKGKEAVEALRTTLERVYHVSQLIDRTDQQNYEGRANASVLTAVKQLAVALQWHTKLKSLERSRVQKLPEFGIYLDTVHSEMEGLSSRLNNHLTAHILD
jgi:hypothetical protein